MKKLFTLLALMAGLNGWGQIISTVAGDGVAGISGDGGQATAADINIPRGITFDTQGNLYIADQNNYYIRKVNTSGIINTVVGGGNCGDPWYCGDGGQATAAELFNPNYVSIDGSGNLYISDGDNHVIRKVNTLGIITTVAGDGTGSGTNTGGYTGDGGQATTAELSAPQAVIIDSNGNLYIADNGNNVIRKVNSSGIISTIVGNGTQGFSGDGGQATAAKLHWPNDIAFDGSGNMYIADAGNNCIRKVNTGGIINTIAGNGTAGFSGDGGQATAAELHYPSNIKFDAIGNLYVSDLLNNRVRMINTSGIINTIVGNGTQGYTGDGGQATAAELHYPSGLAIDGFGNLYLSDNQNSVVRKITNGGQTTGISQYSNLNSNISIYPNPTNSILQVSINNETSGQIKIVDVLGNEIMVKPTPNPSTGGELLSVDVSNLQNGVYFIRVGTSMRKFIVQH